MSPLRCCFSVVAVMLAVSLTPAQTQQPYVAFRVDDERVIVSLVVAEQGGPQVREGLSHRPIARYGYEYFDVPKWWKNVPTDVSRGDHWFLQTSPERVMPATVERLVGGYFDCSPVIGVLLNVAPEHLKVSSARYFLATKTSPVMTSTPQSVRQLRLESLSPEIRTSIERALNDLMVRELPGVREKAAPLLMRAAREGPDRSWAQRRLLIEEQMQAGRGKLRYDVQAFQLAPDGVPVYFARAEWMVGSHQGFAATMWARGDQKLEVLETNVGPSSWMRMSLFAGGVVPTHLGLILNIFDHDRDGWGEVLFANEGYESKTVTLFEYSPTGLIKTGVQFADGC